MWRGVPSIASNSIVLCLGTKFPPPRLPVKCLVPPIIEVRGKWSPTRTCKQRRCIYLRLLISLLCLLNFQLQYNIPLTLAPRAELLKVVGLKNKQLVPGSFTSFSAIVRWEKPLFTQSSISYYVYNAAKEMKGEMKRLIAIGLDYQNTTVSYFLLQLSVSRHIRNFE